MTGHMPMSNDTLSPPRPPQHTTRSGEKNVSVIAAPIYKGFTMQSLGGPQQSAERFLASIAPPESGRTAVLIEASERQDALGTVYYDMEYTLEGPRFFRHNISSYASR